MYDVPNEVSYISLIDELERRHREGEESDDFYYIAELVVCLLHCQQKLEQDIQSQMSQRWGYGSFGSAMP